MAKLKRKIVFQGAYLLIPVVGRVIMILEISARAIPVANVMTEHHTMIAMTATKIAAQMTADYAVDRDKVPG